MSQALIKILQWFSVRFILKLKSASTYRIWSSVFLRLYSLQHSRLLGSYCISYQSFHTNIRPLQGFYTSSYLLHLLLFWTQCCSLFREALLTSYNSPDPIIPRMTLHISNGKNLIQGTSDSSEGRTEKPSQQWWRHPKSSRKLLPSIGTGRIGEATRIHTYNHHWSISKMIIHLSHPSKQKSFI